MCVRGYFKDVQWNWDQVSVLEFIRSNLAKPCLHVHRGLPCCNRSGPLGSSNEKLYCKALLYSTKASFIKICDSHFVPVVWPHGSGGQPSANLCLISV